MKFSLDQLDEMDNEAELLELWQRMPDTVKALVRWREAVDESKMPSKEIH